MVRGAFPFRYGKTLTILGVFLILCFLQTSGFAQELNASPDQVSFKLSLEGGSFSKAVNVFLLMTALSLVPSAVMMMTSFTRIVIVLSFLKQAIGAQNTPSARIVAALALFLTIFIMQPVWVKVYNESIVPYSEKKLDEKAALEKGSAPLKEFMLKQTRESSLLLFMDLANMDPVDSSDALPMTVIIPAFMISELKTAFQMGFLIYLPFLLIDIVVATCLMSMGMMMLPPMMISLPFKLLLFIIVDGWGMVIRSLVSSFS
ncbi:MAG: flagellar biosynthetic protein FliP [Lentisphaerae bacterium GWF2_45_14]|nr:MAG: flagellar biosynthetic protein FliP [Lentisphaerae bacterium GWF2_45_14]